MNVVGFKLEIVSGQAVLGPHIVHNLAAPDWGENGALKGDIAGAYVHNDVMTLAPKTWWAWDGRRRRRVDAGEEPGLVRLVVVVFGRACMPRPRAHAAEGESADYARGRAGRLPSLRRRTFWRAS